MAPNETAAPFCEADAWTHYDLYDKPEPVGQALGKLIPFYKEHLGGSKVAKMAA